MTREELTNESAMVITDRKYDVALVGESYDGCAVYDIDKVIAVDVEGEVTYEEASEWHFFNTFDAFVGEYSPIFIYTE